MQISKDRKRDRLTFRKGITQLSRHAACPFFIERAEEMNIKESLNLGMENKETGTVPLSPELMEERFCLSFPKLEYGIGMLYE